MTPAPSLALCSVQGCDTPTQNYLCNQCTDELQHAWDQIPPLIPVLEDISRGQDVAFYQPTAEGRGGATGSRPPMNLNAYQLALNLRQALVFTPAEYATHSDGWRAHTQILQWVHDADLMVNGEPEDAESKQNIARYKLGTLQPMTGPELATWFSEQLGLKITPGRIRLWAHRGHITPTTTEGHPKYSPVAVYIAYTERNAHV